MATEIGRGATDVVAVLTSQHERARAILAEFHESVAVVAELTRGMAGPFRDLVQLLATHEAGEELVVWPAVRAELQQGPLAAECMAEEDECKRLLAKLEKLGPGFFGFPDALTEFETKLLAHADHEERAVFPLLEEGVAPEVLREMAGDVLYVEATAPSHAHAHSPESVVGNAVLGPVLATIDRVRDATHQ